MSRITLKEISKKLNLSIATISKALNDSHEISDKTKKRVLDYAQKHNYRPNIIAQSLKIGKTNTIGVILSAINNPFYTQVIDGIQELALQLGYDVIIMQSREDTELEKSYIDLIQQRGIDGLLISPIHENSNLEQLKLLHENNIPIVLFDRIYHKLNTHKVGINNFNSSYLATKHLIDIGRKKILNITGSKFGLNEERYKGYKKAHEEAKMELLRDFYIPCDMQNLKNINIELKAKITKLMEGKNKPDAILSSSDIISIQLLGILAELKYEIPQDIALIGFSNFDFPTSLNPPLSTIKQPAYEIGYQAADTLIQLINKGNWKITEPETIELESTITFRKSTLEI